MNELQSEMAGLSPFFEEESSVSEGVSKLIGLLGRSREQMRRSPWLTFCRDVELNPLYEVVMEEPVTRRAAEKPRGYPGDAVLIDYLYEEPWSRQPAMTPTERGRVIYSVLSSTPAATAVRNRRNCLAHQIDKTLAANPSAKILAVSCGHLRELEISQSYRSGRIGQFTAIDADPESLEVVDRRMGQKGVICRQMSTVELLSAKGLGEFDLVYSAGLYDYLTPRIARRVTRKLVELIRPDGRVIVSNFLKGTTEAGYMEAMMDWQLVYRSIEDLRDVISVEGVTVRTCTDQQSRIGYAELRRTEAA